MENPNEPKVNIINAVKTPLGFFVLVVLIVEMIFGISANISSGNERTLLIIGMMALVFFMVLIVAIMAWVRPDSLYGKSALPKMKNKEELSYKESIERMNDSIKRIDEYVGKINATEKITTIVDDTLEHTKDMWIKLLLIRITLRRLLLKIASSNSMTFPPATSISKMLSTFRNAGIIDQYLFSEVDMIRNATYTVEWGQGTSPEDKEVKFALENFEEVFDTLKKRCIQP